MQPSGRCESSVTTLKVLYGAAYTCAVRRRWAPRGMAAKGFGRARTWCPVVLLSCRVLAPAVCWHAWRTVRELAGLHAGCHEGTPGSLP